MGRRSEPRIAVPFAVVVRGYDLHGNPFVADAETYDISFSGASLAGLKSSKEAGSKVEVEFQGQKAWYRVQWIGRPGTSKAGRIGLRSLEQGNYIWGVSPSAWEPDAYHPSSQDDKFPSLEGPTMRTTPLSRKKGEERRQHARRACRIEAQLTLADGSAGPPGTITDISLGGCYVEMLSPLPLGSDVTLAFLAGGTPLRISCKVRSSQNGFGMGVSFTGMKPEDFEALRNFAPPTTSPATGASSVETPKAPVAHSLQPSGAGAEIHALDLPPSPDALEAIVRLLLRKGLLTHAELAEELDKLKTSKT